MATYGSKGVISYGRSLFVRDTLPSIMTDDRVKADFIQSLTIWLTVCKNLQPPKSTPRQHQDLWYRLRAQEIAESVFRVYELKLKPEAEKYAPWNL